MAIDRSTTKSWRDRIENAEKFAADARDQAEALTAMVAEAIESVTDAARAAMDELDGLGELIESKVDDQALELENAEGDG